MVLYSAKNPIRGEKKTVNGQFIDILGERYYEIQNYDEMQPFFISLASDTDLWMYLASTGGLSAGRQSPAQALFPYYTDDKITEQYEVTGPKTIIRAKIKDARYARLETKDKSRTADNRLSSLSDSDLSSLSEAVYLWEPFSQRQAGVYQIRRNISKSTVGNKIVFAEENLTLGLRFSYLWAPAGKYGWVRRATLENLGVQKTEVEILDGLQNLLPAGVERKTQNEFSTLVDGYKKTELVLVESQKSKDKSLITDSAEHNRLSSFDFERSGLSTIGGLALLRMEAILVDRAEPSESLRCNTVFTLGLPDADYLVSSRQLDDFRRGADITPETESKGVRGAIFAHTRFTLPGISSELPPSRTWYFVADVEKDAVAVRDLMYFQQQPDAIAQIDKAILEGTLHLSQIVGQNDGIETTADEHNDARHFANTLFNTMRGGYYLDNYTISGEAFLKHISLFNKAVAQRHQQFLQSLPETIERAELKALVDKENDPQLTRLFLEYLPITFGRRHGDPSRPWNLFNIRVQDENGKPIVSYQGNWRDIFQNWEALSVSYPNYINGIISKFLNATTVDGYNPYKVTSEGIDWEVIEPENPWSNIGYWGDHQIIYLLRLLELSQQHDPEALRTLLNARLFAFANVPYRLKSYDQIVADPKNSILFDDDLHKRINALIPEYGQDARLVLNQQGEVLLTTMADKLLITLLAKLSNFIPEAGIWMNTLRPEWNDANNALVGFGASMVTLCYMRRYISFLQGVIKSDINIARETAELLSAIGRAITCYGSTDDRRQFIDAVGKAGEQYREKAYAGLNGEMVGVSNEELQQFFADTLAIIDDSIRRNKREDGLYEAYNLISFHNNPSTVHITHLYQMLEGQVAVLTSGLLTAEEAADLLDAMRCSDLYREDQRSYMLYPNRRRKTFLELNNIPDEAKDLPVVKKYIGTILKQDRDGGLHFDAAYRNANNLPDDLKDLYEQVFNHQAFTGRSGTFYKYEGLGCIYWHMVSKLLLAVGENIASETKEEKTKEKSQITEHNRLSSLDFERSGLSPKEGEHDRLSSSSAAILPLSTIDCLKQHYYAIREGIGSHKRPDEYGSFPFDAYSHTPSMAGVQQPGMTGQVKEDILSRFFELGLSVENGELHINPYMLQDEDFLNGELRFTYCHTPFVYQKGENKGIDIQFIQNNNVQVKLDDYLRRVNNAKESTNYFIPTEIAQHIFARDGFIKQITVTI